MVYPTFAAPGDQAVKEYFKTGQRRDVGIERPYLIAAPTVRIRAEIKEAKDCNMHNLRCWDQTPAVSSV
jgi:hypothetical protein